MGGASSSRCFLLCIQLLHALLVLLHVLLLLPALLLLLERDGCQRRNLRRGRLHRSTLLEGHQSELAGLLTGLVALLCCEGGLEGLVGLHGVELHVGLPGGALLLAQLLLHAILRAHSGLDLARLLLVLHRGLFVAVPDIHPSPIREGPRAVGRQSLREETTGDGSLLEERPDAHAGGRHPAGNLLSLPLRRLHLSLCLRLCRL